MKNNFNITHAFQQVFFTVVCFTLLCGGASFLDELYDRTLSQPSTLAT